MDEWLDLGDLIDKTDELIELSLFDEALDLLNNYAHIYSEEWELYALYGRIYTDLNDPVTAIEYLRKGLNLNKTSPDCLLGLFYAHAMRREIKPGGRYLFKAEKYHPEKGARRQLKPKWAWQKMQYHQ